MSDHGADAPPEMQTQKIQEGFQIMQEQFAQMMQMMQDSKMETAAAIQGLSDEQVILRDEVSAANTPTKGKYSLSAKIGQQLPPGRRTSQFYKQPEGSRVPKLLQNADGLKDMTKYGGKPNEALNEHFDNFEYHVRLHEPVYWCDLLQLTMSKTVQSAISNHAKTLKAGRNQAQDCPPGWYDYDELKAWLKDKYHRDQYEMELLSRIFFSYTQTGTLDAYLTLIDTKMDLVADDFSDTLKKMLVLAKMDPSTSRAMSRIPATYVQSYSDFCKRALLEYDTLKTSVKTQKYVKPPHKRVVADQAIAVFELVDLHTSKQGGKTFDSPWKPGNKRYENSTPPAIGANQWIMQC